VLEVYFRQCSVLVTARDIVMAATLANAHNPVTASRFMTPYAISDAFVMTSSACTTSRRMDLSRRIPAKSGVGGGILAALPGAAGALQLLAPARQPRQQRARIKVCRRVTTYDLAHAQPQRRARTASRRLQHREKPVAAQPSPMSKRFSPPSPGGAPSRRFP